MTAHSELEPGGSPYAVSIGPDPVDAGAGLTLSATATFDPPADITGRSLSILDEEDREVARLTFASFAGGSNFTDEVVVPAPLEPGQHQWKTIVEDDGEEHALPLLVSVRAHKRTLLAWDVPATTVAGEPIALKIGVKCSAQCDHTGAEIVIRDHNGQERARATLGDQFWPGTSMHFCEVRADGEAEEGLHKWSAEIAPSSDLPPHDGASANFSLRIVPTPECRVIVEAYDNAGTTPIAGANVVLHPYRGLTDPQGAAAFMVPKGSYRVLVSKAKHEAVSLQLDVDGDITTRTRLSLEPPEDPDAHYL